MSGKPPARHSRRDPYREVVNAWDPDLPPGPPMPDDPGDHYTHPSAVLFAAAARVVDGEHRVEADGSERVTPPLPASACVLSMHCVGPCGPDGRGAHLARVWRVPGYGLLYRAVIARPRDHAAFPDLHPDACVMVHSGLEAERGSGPDDWATASWVTERALPRWSRKGWQRAPAGVVPARRWDPGRLAVVRDLLDRDDVEHVPLRVSCPRHGPAVLDRDRVRREIARDTPPQDPPGRGVRPVTCAPRIIALAGTAGRVRTGTC